MQINYKNRKKWTIKTFLRKKNSCRKMILHFTETILVYILLFLFFLYYLTGREISHVKFPFFFQISFIVISPPPHYWIPLLLIYTFFFLLQLFIALFLSIFILSKNFSPFETKYYYRKLISCYDMLSIFLKRFYGQTIKQKCNKMLL